jgi:hypothetical protein
MTRAAHRPESPRPTILRTPTELRMALHQLAGEWESLATQVELSTLPRIERRGATPALRLCVDELLAVLDGEL